MAIYFERGVKIFVNGRRIETSANRKPHVTSPTRAETKSYLPFQKLETRTQFNMYLASGTVRNDVCDTGETAPRESIGGDDWRPGC